jgi:hypothetical protein
MLKNFEYYFDDPVSAIEELQQLPYALLKFGYINDYVYNSIHEALAVIYKTEIKKLAKDHSVDEITGQFMSDFFPSDVFQNVKNKTQFVTDYRNAISFVVNSTSFLMDEEAYKAAAEKIKEMR